MTPRSTPTPPFGAIVLSLASIGGLLAPATPAQETTGPIAVIQIIEVESSDDAARIAIATSAPVGVMVSRTSAEKLVFHLRPSVPGPDLAPRKIGAGLLSSVVPRSDEEAQFVNLAVEAREPVASRVSSDGATITITLTPQIAESIAEPAAEATGATEAAPEPAPPATDEVRIGPGDLIQIDVFGLDELDRRARVLRDGTVSLPLLGAVSLAGMTLAEAERSLADLLAERQILRDPQVTIFVEEYVSHTVSIQGAVEQPGVYPLAGRTTLLDLLGAAGGLSGQRGDRILVLRGGENGREPERIEIDAWRLVEEGDYTVNLALEAGDIVMVPRARELRVYVTGAVRNPGPVEYASTDGITVLQAITAAGGPTERANLKNVHVIRNKFGREQERIEVNLKRIQAGKEEDLVLERNDTVVVGEWFF